MGYEIAFIGLVLSLLFTGLTGVYPGGIIVPSYLVLFLNQPELIVGTLVAAILTLIVYRLASQYLILFGRRRFVFLILLAVAWKVRLEPRLQRPPPSSLQATSSRFSS